MRIAVVTMGVKLGRETCGYDRFRTIACMLAAAGFHVDLITSSFQHWEKAQRDVADPAYDDDPFDVVFIHEPGYKRNVDPARIASHAIAARNLSSYFAGGPRYDLVYAEVPPNDVALACAMHCEKQGIPFVVDVNDLWPEAMRMVLDVPVISDVAFAPLARDARRTFARCTAVVGTSEEYVARPLRDMTPEKAAATEQLVVYVGNDVAAFDAEAERNAALVRKPDGERWITYAGTLGTSYDIANLLHAMQLVKLVETGGTDAGAEGATGTGTRATGSDAGAASASADGASAGALGDGAVARTRLMILGSGPLEDELRELATALDVDDCVTFAGYLPHEEMAAYLVASDILLNSFGRKAPQSIVTKIGDYLAAGKPMINTCPSPEFRAKVAHDGFGVNVEPGEPVDLAGAIFALFDNDEARTAMGRAARIISHSQFDRPRAYGRIVDLVERLTATRE